MEVITIRRAMQQDEEALLKTYAPYVENPTATRSFRDDSEEKTTDIAAQEQHGGGRLEAFEKMLSEVQQQYEDIEVKMAELKMEGKEKTTSYRQLMANKLRLGDMLAMYKLYDLL